MRRLATLLGGIGLGLYMPYDSRLTCFAIGFTALGLLLTGLYLRWILGK